MKIDVEAAEVAVLRGAVGVLERARPLLFVDIHGTNADVADLLDASGYIYWVLSATERSKQLRDAPWWVAIAAAPKERAAEIGERLGLYGVASPRGGRHSLSGRSPEPLPRFMRGTGTPALDVPSITPVPPAPTATRTSRAKAS